MIMIEEKNIMQDLSLDLVILDDHKMIAEMLKHVLKKFSFIRSTEIFSEADLFFEHLKKNKAHVLLLDVFMPGIDGIEVLKKCRKKYKSDKLKIIVLTSSLDPEIISTALSNGVDAFLTKEDFSSELTAAFPHMFSNPTKPYISKNATEILLFNKTDKYNGIKLSAREKELLKFICEAKTAKEIAHDLDLSVNTIYFYTKRLLGKMEVNRTQDLIIKAMSLGLFEKK